MAELIDFGTFTVNFLRDKHDTQGGLDMFELTTQPKGKMPVPHYHDNWDETVYGIEGVTTYVIDGVVHYGVANMPGAVSRTSTYALTNATLPWVRTLARMGGENAVRENAPLRTALNVWKGKVTHRGVAEAFDMPYVPAVDALA